MPATTVTKQDDGVLLGTKVGTIKLQVWADGVLRMICSPTDRLSPTPSLAVIAKPNPTNWKLDETHDQITVTTSKMSARINRATGAASFYDSGGNLLLEEPASGGKSLTPASIEGQNTYRIEQSFELQPGEAIYGLGQHQQGIMNYAGSTVHLLQENREVAIPVLLSSRGYGILWDNPSVTDVDAAGTHSHRIPTQNLFSADGKAGGLTAQYFSDQDLTHLQSTRIDPAIDFNWTKTPPPGLHHDHYSARWTGQIQTLQAGQYTFEATADDGIRLWVNGKLLIEDWNARPAVTKSGMIQLAANSRYDIKVEYFQDVNDALIHLGWSPPSAGGKKMVRWNSEAGNGIDYYVMAGPELEQVIASYRHLTGKAPLFPRWAWGFWQCKEHYESQQDLLGVLETYRSMHIPIDCIIQDWFYWDPKPWGSHFFDPTRYPDPAAMMRKIHEEHAHAIISVWARFAEGSDNFRRLHDAGLLLPRTGDGSEYNQYGYYYDPFNAVARDTYWQLMRDQIFSKGFDGWWLDASEPELGEKWGEFRSIKTAAGPGAFVFNAYPLMHTTAVYQGQRQAAPNQRVFILTRSAYAGQQRNAAVTWSGDIQGDWKTFADQIPAGLNFSLSGIPYWNTDIGGFFGHDPLDANYRELFLRWFQFGAFCPMFRTHGTDKPKEMWRFGPDAMQIQVKYDRLRYRLLPYIYSTAWMVTHQDSTMMRPLVMDFRNDPSVLSIGDQYLFGPAIMVNPVTRAGATSRKVYLPSGCKWTDFWTGKTRDGGQSIVADAPLEKLPLFVRGGSIVPMGPVMEYADEKPADPIELRIYPGSDGNFDLYEDENDGYGYEKGTYATIPLHWNDADHTLTIGGQAGRFPGMLQTRTFHVIVVRPNSGAGVEPVDHVDREIRYSGQPVTVKL